MRRLHADLILFACAAIWGLAFLFQKSAMAHVGPLLFVAARSIVACLALVPLVIHEQRTATHPLPPGFARASLVVGTVFFLGAALQQNGIVSATVTSTGFLTALYVVITLFMAWALMRRRPSGAVWIAVALSFTGTWLLGGGGVAAFSRGDGLVALSAVFWALHIVLLGKAAALGCPALLTALQFVVVGALSLAGALAIETIDLAQLRLAAIDIAFVGLLSSALTFTLLTMALRHTAPTEAAIIISTDTLFAALGAALVLGERLSWIGCIGAALILVAILLVQLAPVRPTGSPGPIPHPPA